MKMEKTGGELLLPIQPKIEGVKIEKLPLDEAKRVASKITRASFFSFQSSGFVYDIKEGNPRLTLFEGVAGRGTNDIPNPSGFELLLGSIDEGSFSDSLFWKTSFVLSKFLSEELRKRGFTQKTAPGDFSMKSTSEKMNMALVSIPEEKSFILTLLRDEMPLSQMDSRNGTGNLVITTSEDVDLVEYISKFGHKGIYTLLGVLFSFQNTPKITDETEQHRQFFLPWPKEVQAEKIDLIHVSVNIGDLEKLKIKPPSKKVSIFEKKK